MDEIKNNEFDKPNKEKDYYRTYLKSIQKKPFIIKQENFQNDFIPNVYKHPENIYLKAIFEYQNKKEKLKLYDKKTGIFDIYLNRTKKNKIYIDAENKSKNIDSNNITNNNNIIKISDNNIYSKDKIKEIKKKSICE